MSFITLTVPSVTVTTTSSYVDVPGTTLDLLNTLNMQVGFEVSNSASGHIADVLIQLSMDGVDWIDALALNDLLANSIANPNQVASGATAQIIQNPAWTVSMARFVRVRVKDDTPGQHCVVTISGYAR